MEALHSASGGPKGSLPFTAIADADLFPIKGGCGGGDGNGGGKKKGRIVKVIIKKTTSSSVAS